MPGGALVSPALRGQKAGATVSAARVKRASRQRSRWGGGSDIVVGPPRAGTKAGAAGAARAAAARTQRRRGVSQSERRLSNRRANLINWAGEPDRGSPPFGPRVPGYK